MIPDKKELIASLAQTPVILETFIAGIPVDRLPVVRKPQAWSIHTHVCHLAETQGILLRRLQKFEQEEFPVITPFFPADDDESIEISDTATALGAFTSKRKEQLEIIESFGEEDWEKKGTHDEYIMYDLHILVRHILMHDYVYLYRIEEAWLTKDEYL